MGEVNRAADVGDDAKSKNGGRYTQDFEAGSRPLTGFSGKCPVRGRMENVWLVAAAVLFVLCIVFIALFAKEASRDDDSSKDHSKG